MDSGIPVDVGQRLGPYEIVSLIGSGGMGSVYRARDTRLHRDVALKLLASGFASDAERLRRFEAEARAAAQLNHPNIAAVYDVGTFGETTYVVEELVSGRTLRTILDEGPLPIRTAVDSAMQIAEALAAAHERGIVHRDLKPENVLITNDGRVKIIDFGLAKLAASSHDEEAKTAVKQTAPGMVMGTAPYMAPEQARGQEIDARADIFSFGAVLYEMLSGHRAFAGETTTDVLAAILTSDPPALERIPPALDRIVRHCLEKNRERRFQSARDVAFALEAVLSPSGAIAVPSAPARNLPWPSITVAVLAAIVGALLAWMLGGRSPVVRYHQLTFRNGTIQSARFSPDGNTVVYGAAWEGRPVEIFTARADSPESRPLELPDADVAAISSTGELLVLLHPKPHVFWSRVGTLARVPLAGGTPREILDGVDEADWSPDGATMAIVRDAGGRARLEYPPGDVLFSTTGWITHARVAPDGRSIAFIHHPTRPDDGGDIDLVDLQGHVRTLSSGWTSAGGLAWSGNTIVFSGARSGVRALYRVTQHRKTTLIADAPLSLIVLDVARNGQMLVAGDSNRSLVKIFQRPSRAERDLSWLDYAAVRDLSVDGRTFLFDESGEGGGPKYSVYIRNVDGSPAVRIGDGIGSALSRDAHWAICVDVHQKPAPLTIVPTGAGEARQIATPGLHHEWAAWFPDGRTIVFSGVQNGASRLYVQTLDGGAPRPITPDGVRLTWGSSVSPDGQLIAAIVDGRIAICRADGKRPPHSINRVDPGAIFAGWSNDPRVLYTTMRKGSTLSVDRVNVDSEAIEHVTDIALDPLLQGRTARLTPDGNTIGYSVRQQLTNLFLVDAR